MIAATATRSPENGERLLDFRHQNAPEARRGIRHRRVANVKFAAQRHLEFIAAQGKTLSLCRKSGVADSLRAIG
jgi:hypothetical protein